MTKNALLFTSLYKKVPENRDQGIGLNGTVKTKSLPCSLQGGAAAGWRRAEPDVPRHPLRRAWRGQHGGAGGGGVCGRAPCGIVPGHAPCGIVPCHAQCGIVTGHAPSGIVPGRAPCGIVPGRAPCGIVPGHSSAAERRLVRIPLAMRLQHQWRRAGPAV